MNYSHGFRIRMLVFGTQNKMPLKQQFYCLNQLHFASDFLMPYCSGLYIPVCLHYVADMQFSMKNAALNLPLLIF